jgi:hypothetical protein
MKTRKPVPASLKPRGFDGTDEDSRRIEAVIEPRNGTWSMLPAAAVCDRSLGNVTPLHVLAWLCKYRNTKTGECFPSVERVAKDLGITARSVQRHVEKLIECRHMVVMPRRNPATGKQTSNAYYILFGEVRGPADKPETLVTPGPTVDSTKAPGEPLMTSAPRVTPRVTLANLGATYSVVPVGLKRPGKGNAPCRGEGDASCRGEGDASCREGVTPDVVQNYPTGTNQLNEPVAELHARAREVAAHDGEGDSGTRQAGSLAVDTPREARQQVPVPKARDMAPPALAQDLIGNVIRGLAKITGQHQGLLWKKAVEWHNDLVAAGFSDEQAQIVIAEEGAIALKHGSELGGELVRILDDCIQARIDQRKGG